MEARFSGRCGLCEKAIQEGEQVVKLDDEWCHLECAEEEGYEG